VALEIQIFNCSLLPNIKNKIKELKTAEPELAIQNVKDAFGSPSLITFMHKIHELSFASGDPIETFQQSAKKL
jgi:hypothetical protein